MADGEAREPQDGEEAAPSEASSNAAAASESGIDETSFDEALVEAADLLEHESEPEEAASADAIAEAAAFTAIAMQVTLPDEAPEPTRPGRLEGLLGGVAERMPALVVPVSVEAVILTALISVGFLAFVLIEPTPRWLALLLAIVAGLGADGVLRAARHQPFASGADTTPFLFLPALFALATPVFLEYNVEGFWAVPAALLAGLAFGSIVVAEVASVRVDEPLRVPARFVAAAATYFVVFALFSLAYAFDLDLAASVIAVGLIGVLLAVELLRDDQIDAYETLVLAGVIGVIVGEARWVLQYMPIDGYLAGLTLLLLFYFVTGVAHAYVVRQLDRTVAFEYGAVAIVGLLLVAGVRIAGVA